MTAGCRNANVRQTPVITVVMPCFNARTHVSVAIKSLLRQTLPDWQLMVVDDGSTDGTADFVETIGDERIRVVRQPNAGVSSARNRGLAEVRSPLVAFLDSDDCWVPEFLRIMVDALARAPDAAVAYCGWEDVHLPPRRRQVHDPPDFEAAGPRRWELLLRRCPWVIHAAVARTEEVRAAGGFDPQFAIAEDFLLWLRVAARGRIVKVPGCMASYHHDDGRPRATSDVVRVVRQTRDVLRVFLDEQPQIARRLGGPLRRHLIYRQSLRSGYDALWSRQLRAAQALFRDCLAGGYFGRRDLKYLLPALLPAVVFGRLVRGRDGAAAAPTRQ
jgi:glycosyltransferase involved in cell wall biosynthesis